AASAAPRREASSARRRASAAGAACGWRSIRASGLLNRSVNRGVAGAAAQIAGKADANLLERRTAAERGGGHDHARRTDPALRVQHKGHKGHRGISSQNRTRPFLCVLGVLCVDGTPQAMTFSGVAGISLTSKPACRSALMTAGAGPSIGISPTPFAPNGPCAYGLSRMTMSIFGVSSVVGMM